MTGENIIYFEIIKLRNITIEKEVAKEITEKQKEAQNEITKRLWLRV